MGAVLFRKTTRRPDGGEGGKRNGVYYGRFRRLNGERVTVSLATHDEQTARIKLLELQRRAALQDAGLLSPYEDHRRRPIGEHIAAWRESLKAQACHPRHIRDTIHQVLILMDRCGIATWSDLERVEPDDAVTRIERCLVALRSERRLSTETVNHYVKSIKAFASWMVARNRAGSNPVRHLHRGNPQVDRRLVRAAWTPQQASALLAATVAGPQRGDLSGPERALLWRFAFETGLRAGEIRSLTCGDVDFGSAVVRLGAAHSKHRMADDQPIGRDLAGMLARHVAGRLPSARLFAMPSHVTLLAWLRADMALAGVPAANGRGERLDGFHALRHTYITWIGQAASPAVARDLARHRSTDVTQTYLHTTSYDQDAALAAIEANLSADQEVDRAKATGTHDGRPLAATLAVKGNSQTFSQQRFRRPPPPCCTSRQRQGGAVATPSGPKPAAPPTPFSSSSKGADVNFQYIKSDDRAHFTGQRDAGDANSLLIDQTSAPAASPAGTDPAAGGGREAPAAGVGGEQVRRQTPHVGPTLLDMIEVCAGEEMFRLACAWTLAPVNLRRAAMHVLAMPSDQVTQEDRCQTALAILGLAEGER